MNSISLKNVTIEKDENKILNNISLEIPSGKISCVIGPNGAGKSTIASLIMGLERFSEFSGEIYFGTKLINDLSVSTRAKLGITLAWQNPAEFEGITIKKYMKAACKNGDQIKKSLETVGLEPNIYLNRELGSKLSGGERKRLELAVVHAMKPKVAIIDEPDSGVDVESMKFIFKTIDSLKKNKTTVIIITHDIQILEKSDYGFLICNGKLVDEGDAKHISKYFLNKCLRCKTKNEF